MSMNFTSAGKSYGGPSSNLLSGSSTLNQNSTTNMTSGSANSGSLGQTQERPGVEARIFGNKNQQGFQNFPNFNLKINRVNSKEYKERQQKEQQQVRTTTNYSYNQTLTNSLYVKPYTRDSRGSDKMSTSVDKTGGSNYLNPREVRESYNSATQLDSQKVSYGARYNYGSYKRDNNAMSPRYANDKDSQNGSAEKQGGPTYKRIQHLGITPNMVSSVISRQSNQKGGNYGDRLKPLSTSSRGKDDDVADEAYNLYSSRHPTQTIRKSTIQISKAISSNAITQLERQNQTQSKTIKKLQSQLQSFKSSLQKWDDVKNKYQMDLQAKTRHIFDLERSNKRLSEEVQSLRTFRTMQTVQQVIIARLKQQIMHLNKKIIEMQAQYYKNQKLMMSKQTKDTVQTQESDKQVIKKLQINIEAQKKQIELLSEELKKQKQKSWKLQRERQQYLAEKQFTTENYERELNNAKTDITILNQEVLKNISIIRAKDANIQQIKKTHSTEIQKLTEKNNTNESQINKIKAELTQQIQVKQKEASSKKMQEQLARKIQQQKQNFDSLLAQKIQEQKKAFDVQLNNQLRNKQTFFNQRLQQQKQTFESKSQQDKETVLLQKLDEQKKLFDNELNTKLAQKQQQYKNKLNQEMRKFQTKIVQQGKQDKVNTSQISNKYQGQIRNLKIKIDQDANLINSVRSQNQMIKAAIKQRENQINTLKVDNLKFVQNAKKQSAADKQKWLRQQTVKIQHVIRLKLQTEIKQKQRQLEQKTSMVHAMEVQNNQMKATLEREKQQATKIAVQAQKQVQEKANASIKQLEAKYQELENKYNNVLPEISTLKADKMKLEQKNKQDEIDLKRANDNLNIWKLKAQNAADMEQEREQLRAKVKELQDSKGARTQLLTKFDELSTENQIMKQKLKAKQEQNLRNQSAIAKIKGYYDTDQNKKSALSKQIKALESKVIETQSKFKAILTRVQLEEYKYKELYDKLVADSQTYLVYIKKLQEQNELIYQKYLKLRKLCRLNKIKVDDDNETHQKVDYSTFRQFLEKQVYTSFTNMILPAFQSKISQKMAAIDSNLAQKQRRIIQIKYLAQRIKNSRRNSARK